MFHITLLMRKYENIMGKYCLSQPKCFVQQLPVWQMAKINAIATKAGVGGVVGNPDLLSSANPAIQEKKSTSMLATTTTIQTAYFNLLVYDSP